ncbi:MAG TPA: VOC family protein [Thermoanaerobaculia bacterium]
MAVKPIPDGYHSVTPYLAVRNAAAALEFYKKAFGAEELLRMPAPDGKIAHAEIRIGDSIVMLADEHPDMDFVGPQTRGGATSTLMIYVEDVDARFKSAIDAGATVTRPLKDEFYGDRAGSLRDPFGHVWLIATHKEDVTPEQMEERMKAARP